MLKEEFRQMKSSSLLIRDELVAPNKVESRTEFSSSDNDQEVGPLANISQTILDIILNVTSSSPELLWDHCVGNDQREVNYSLLTLFVTNYDADSSNPLIKSIESIVSLLTKPRYSQFFLNDTEELRIKFVKVFWHESHQVVMDKISAGDKKKDSYFQLLSILFKGLVSNKAELKVAKLFDADHLASFLVAEMTRAKSKASAYYCLSVIHDMISVLTEDNSASVTPLTLGVVQYLVNYRPRGLLLSKVSHIFLTICKLGFSKTIVEVLSQYQEKLLSPSRVREASKWLTKYQVGIDNKLDQETLVSLFQHKESIELRRPCSIDAELASFMEPGQTDLILPDFGEMEQSEGTPVKLLKLN